MADHQQYIIKSMDDHVGGSDYRVIDVAFDDTTSWEPLLSGTGEAKTELAVTGRGATQYAFGVAFHNAIGISQCESKLGETLRGCLLSDKVLSAIMRKTSIAGTSPSFPPEHHLLQAFYMRVGALHDDVGGLEKVMPWLLDLFTPLVEVGCKARREKQRPAGSENAAHPSKTRESFLRLRSKYEQRRKTALPPVPETPAPALAPLPAPVKLLIRIPPLVPPAPVPSNAASMVLVPQAPNSPLPELTPNSPNPPRGMKWSNLNRTPADPRQLGAVDLPQTPRTPGGADTRRWLANLQDGVDISPSYHLFSPPPPAVATPRPLAGHLLFLSRRDRSPSVSSSWSEDEEDSMLSPTKFFSS
ncbi:hypothetical protein FB45DRAFT_1050913 [Roridomyces roridus]|uniref:Uncharacterized protein n=1 Tax=Roridomyces roridus TaxID=1738132 RepID=A0AAD7CKG4_9AGAR|nr:hypothetical protein FB45DRAFT_1050913 [Roridomyces roridus]